MENWKNFIEMVMESRGIWKAQKITNTDSWLRWEVEELTQTRRVWSNNREPSSENQTKGACHLSGLAGHIIQFINARVLPNRELPPSKMTMLWKDHQFGQNCSSLISAAPWQIGAASSDKSHQIKSNFGFWWKGRNFRVENQQNQPMYGV